MSRLLIPFTATRGRHVPLFAVALFGFLATVGRPQVVLTLALSEAPVEERTFEIGAAGTIPTHHWGVVSDYTVSGGSIDLDIKFDVYPSQPTVSQWEHWTEIEGGILPGWYNLTVSTYRRDGIEYTWTSSLWALMFVAPLRRDLVPANPTVDPQRVRPGHTVSIVASIELTGNGDADGFRVGFYLSSDSSLDGGDRLLGQTDLLNLNPGQQRLVDLTARIPSDAAPGDRHIFAAVDSLGVVMETNEDNNFRGSPITLVNTPERIAEWLAGIWHTPPPGCDADGDGDTDISDVVISANMGRAP